MYLAVKALAQRIFLPFRYDQWICKTSCISVIMNEAMENTFNECKKKCLT